MAEDEPGSLLESAIGDSPAPGEPAIAWGDRPAVRRGAARLVAVWTAAHPRGPLS
ncbi:hypothetical protein AB0B45_02980 [Nonomuraea sp. NPDC049152]|uniref:hypothetical protein n=1 Tax=Nonomuraea sp. NPDC049152 TaxID=3154350 RepID=UPI0033DA98A4